MGSRVTKDEYEASETKFMEIEDAGDDLGKMLNCLEEGRVFLQPMCRQEDPSTHILKVKQFWKMPYGPNLLSKYFEWLVDGSTEGDLSVSIQDHLDCVLRMTVKILGDKKGESWLRKLEEVENNCEAKNGNDILKQVFIIRELAKSWKNDPEKIIFIQGEDDNQKASDQPYINIVKVDKFGEGDHEETVVISVKVGRTTIFEDVSLCVGLAVIQLSFVFHLLYPISADDIFNYVQRILGKFGPSEGAKNMKGQVKKRFIDFQCAIADIVLLEKKGTVQKLYV